LRGGPPGPAAQDRQPPPGAQLEEGAAEPDREVLENTESWRSTRLLPQLGQLIAFLPAVTDCSFWKS
jgi:hypothetical protein